MLLPKKCLRWSAGLALLGSIAFASEVQAQAVTNNVDFNATIPPTCTITGTAAGILEKPGVLAALEGSGGLGGGFGTGTSATRTVNCTGTGSLTVGVPTQVTAPAGYNPTVRQSVAQVGANSTSANVGGNFDTGAWDLPTAPIALPTGTSTVGVGMVAGERTAGAVLPGIYTYRVTLTVTPN